MCCCLTNAEKITYTFNDVEVLYAAEFQVTPVAVEENNWFTEIAGGKDKPLQILYGIVKLKTNGYGDMKEVFIKISGENGSERFLHNSMSFRESYDKTLFWSGKKLDGTTIIKDYSQPLKAVTLKKNFDTNQKITSIDLYFAKEGDGGSFNNEFWAEQDPIVNVYKADMSTLNTDGDAIAARNILYG